MTDNGTNWTLRAIPGALTVCKVGALSAIDWDAVPLFVGRTEEEISVVCPTARAPQRTTAREDGWRGFSIVGTLDFSLVGVLSRLSGALAQAGVGLFAVSTYNTDTILVKEESFERAVRVLEDCGCRFL